MPAPKKGGPHIRTRDSVPRRMWTVVSALAPTVVVRLLVSGFPWFRILVVSSAAALLVEMGMQKLWVKRVTLYDGSALVTAILFALLLPTSIASWEVALGAAFGIIFGKQIFGGLGQNPFNPALVGCAFVFLAFPSSREFIPEPLTQNQSLLLLAVVFGGGIFLFFTRLIHWEIPLLYLVGYVLVSLALGPGEKGELLSWPILLASFFIVTDPVTTPLTRMGEKWFAVGAGVLSALLGSFSSEFQGLTYGILWMNALVPWLDRRFRPQ